MPPETKSPQKIPRAVFPPSQTWPVSMKPRQPINELRWRQCERYFAAALEYDHRGIALDAVRADFLKGRYAILPGGQSALLIEPATINGKRHLHLYLGGGELREIVDVLVPRAETIAKYYGCWSVMITGRKGWAKALAHRGYLAVEKYSAWWLVAKPVFPISPKDRTKFMSVNNFSLSPKSVMLATDTLASDVRDWWPSAMASKAAFVPHLGVLITGRAWSDMISACLNYSLFAPVRDVDGLVPAFPSICRQAYREGVALLAAAQPGDSYLSDNAAAINLFGWSNAQQRIVGYRFDGQHDFGPAALPDGIHAHPQFSGFPAPLSEPGPASILRDMAIRQHQLELCRPIEERNAIGGDILIWTLEADAAGKVTSSVRPIHRFDTYEADMALIEGKAA